MPPASGFLTGDISSRFKQTNDPGCVVITNTLAACTVAAEDLASAAGTRNSDIACCSMFTIVCTVPEARLEAEMGEAWAATCVIVLATGYCTLASDELRGERPA